MEWGPKITSGFDEGVETSRPKSFTYTDTSNPENPSSITFEAISIPDADKEYKRRTGKDPDLRRGNISRSFVYNHIKKTD